MPIELQSPAHHTHGRHAPGQRTPPQRTVGTTRATDGIGLSDVSRAYRDRHGATVQALDGVSLRAEHGELLAVVGPSGCGKTTLLELICGLQVPDQGVVECAPAALMPQRDLLLPWLCAVDNAALALRIAGCPRADARARAAELFAELGLQGFEQAHPHELSGGMRQRVAFLRTLLSGKPVLCLDEPFGALDAITRAEMQAWLGRALEREPRTVVLVTHDVEEAVVLADRLAVLSPRPGRLRAEIEINRPRPRSRTDAAVVALRERALIALGLGAAAGQEIVMGTGMDSGTGAGLGKRAMRRRLVNAMPAIVLVAALLGAWEIYADSGATSSSILPAPHTIAESLWSNAGLLGHNLAVTAEEVVLGLALALALGFALGVLIHLSPPLRRACYPLTVGSQAVPIAVIAPLLVFLLGFGLLPKLIVIVLICFFPVVVTTVDGLAAVDPDQLKLLRTLDASRLQAFRFAELPAALPAAISGARIAVTVGVIGAYIAESETATSGAYAGLGHEINADLSSLETARAYAAAVVLFAFAIACFYILSMIERRLAPWANQARGDIS